MADGAGEFDPIDDAFWYARGFPARPDPTSDHPLGVVDGDTADVVVDLGFHGWHAPRVRLEFVDTREVYGVDHGSEEYERGMLHSEAAHEWVREVLQTANGAEADIDWPFLVHTYGGTWKFGRWPAAIRRRDTGELLSEHLLERFDDVEDLRGSTATDD